MNLSIFRLFYRKIPLFWRYKVKSVLYKLYFREYYINKWYLSGKPLPLPHVVKQHVIDQYRRKYGHKIFIETGTYLGDMIEAQRNNFDKIYSIELGINLWNQAVRRFKRYSHIRIIQGNSGKVLSDIINELNEPAIFWLDGHYSGGITAKEDTDCPILEEINSILRGKPFNHVILVDDASYFNGEGDFPQIETVAKFIQDYDSRYKVKVEYDIIHFTI